ncbi:D-alanyl-D-alanine carboxypeptidase [Mongoliitalea daihaiensis]|uniref:D-alanyl-D-alanine carboxypeptidase n=1 Tax=Mongoliitalea daihaiensis TaxID=2782006 RepID=UPI001F411B09|nr:D-alanyl-D-alanine carboxypeptidase [Mongoliitalea daihaiensis]UJP63668.1 D-alanyl-D-alanine carboxypeptidase [Mongoliitalea daihaiensis]
MRIIHVIRLACILSIFVPALVFAQSEEIRQKYERFDDLLGIGSFFDNHLTGFVLVDLDSQQVIYEKNSHLNFIPASTVKIFTFYATLKTLRDSTHTFRYVTEGNTIKIWGAGDPSWQYHKVNNNSRIDQFLNRFSEIQLSYNNWKDHAFGYGWQWDDYYYAYSAERSPLPIFGNLAIFNIQQKKPQAQVPVFASMIKTYDKSTWKMERDLHSNTFFYNPNTYNQARAELPFITSPELTQQLMEYLLKKKVSLHTQTLPANHKLFKSGSLRPLWIELMQESDNFIAEQLLLMVSDYLFAELDAERAIEFIQKTYLNDLPDKAQWVDGSGLSRHNLSTPRAMIQLLSKLEEELPRAELMRIFPQGGINGTIKNNYKAQRPYVFAKTGTMSNNHSLIGYIKGDSGRVYAFAFMNSNYLNKASEVRREMEKVLLFVKEEF